VKVAIVYNYNRQIIPPAPLVNLIIKSPEDPDIAISAPALIDTGADYSVITQEIFEKLAPLRVGTVYIENFTGEGDTYRLYSVNIEIHDWLFEQVPVLLGSDDYVILGRDMLNNFDLRLNGIDGKLEFLRGQD
jgi:predicted aspartyl protease